MPLRTFSDYTIDIDITVRRRKDQYSSDTLAEFNGKQVLTLADTDVYAMVESAVDSAVAKVTGQMRARERFHADLKALEAGDTVDA